jgi:hypothetical protein
VPDPVSGPTSCQVFRLRPVVSVSISSLAESATGSSTFFPQNAAIFPVGESLSLQ